MSDDTILYKYKKPKGERTLTDDERAAGIHEPMPAHHPGVPLRDLTRSDLAGMPEHTLATIAASDLYEATPEGTRAIKAAERAAAKEAAVETKTEP